MAQLETGRNGQAGLVRCLAQTAACHLTFEERQPLLICQAAAAKEVVCDRSEGLMTVFTHVSLTIFSCTSVTNDPL